MIQGLGSLPYEEMLRELALLRLRGDLITMFLYLKDGYKEDGNPPFTRTHMEKTSGNGYKFVLEKFQLDTRKIFHNENNQPLEQSRQGSDGFPNTAQF